VKSPRLSTSQRGYGAAHQAPGVASSRSSPRAWRCAPAAGSRFAAGEPFDLDHTDDGAGYLGPSHQRCNRGQGARNGARRSQTGSLKPGYCSLLVAGAGVANPARRLRRPGSRARVPRAGGGGGAAASWPPEAGHRLLNLRIVQSPATDLAAREPATIGVVARGRHQEKRVSSVTAWNVVRDREAHSLLRA
jgi:hypothetical protein